MKKAMKKSDEPNEIALKVARLYVELELQALSIPFFNIASHMVPYHTPRMEPEEEEKEARKLERMGKGERDTANCELYVDAMLSLRQANSSLRSSLPSVARRRNEEKVLGGETVRGRGDEKRAR